MKSVLLVWYRAISLLVNLWQQHREEYGLDVNSVEITLCSYANDD